MKLLVFACVAIVAAALTLTAGAAVSSEMTDEESLMMSLMGGGIEEPAEAAEVARPAAARAFLSRRSSGIRSIDVPGAVATRAYGINAGGEIVGSSTDATGTYGYLWSNGSTTKIAFPGAVFTEAWGINPQGDIVGRYRHAGEAGTHGFLLTDGAYTDISVGDHMHTLPIKISPSREIVGCFHDMDFLHDMRGYMQRGDDVTSFELLPSTMHNGVAPGGGTIAGISFDSFTQVHSYVLERGAYSQFDYPGATFTEAWDVNPSGTVVGYFNPVASHGFSLDADGFTRIDVPDAKWTRIFGINPQGDMVGSYADASSVVHAFLLRGRGDS